MGDIVRAAFVSVVVVAACGGTPDDSIRVDSVEPNFGPLSGGTRVVIKGDGFLTGGAPPNRVIFGDVEAPLAAAADDSTLEVTVPPGTVAGEVEIVVFNRNDTATASGLFHYSTTPTIASISPDEVLFDAGAQITVTGTGFQDEGAGVVDVLVNGVPAVDVEVVSDTQITFTSLPGQAFADVDVEVINRRGAAALERAYRFTPTTTPALVLFTLSATTFAVVYDPVNDVRIDIPNRSPNAAQGFRAVVRDENGDFFGVDRATNRLGRIDFNRQLVEEPIQLNTSPVALIRDGDTTFGFDRGGNRFGTFDLASGSLAPISAGQLTHSGNCCRQIPGGTAFAINPANGDMFFYNAQGISQVNKTTGARTGATRQLNPQRHMRYMQFIGNELFGITPQGEVLRIDPATGANTTIKTLNIEARGVELFAPKGPQ